MSTAVDDILRELAGISFSEDADVQPAYSPKSDDVVLSDIPGQAPEMDLEEKKAAFLLENGKRQSPSVTETLTAVLAMFEKPDEEMRDLPQQEKGHEAEKEKKQPDFQLKPDGKRRKENREKTKQAAKPQRVRKFKQPKIEEQAQESKCLRDTMQVPAQNPDFPNTAADKAYTRVIRVPLQELAGDSTARIRSKREKLFADEAYGHTTRRFASRVEPSLREEKLQGGASLKKVTRRASSSEIVQDHQYPEVKRAKVRMDTEKRQQLPEDEITSENTVPAKEQVQTAEEIIAGLLAEETDLPHGETAHTRPLHIDVDEIRSVSPEPVEIPAASLEEEMSEGATRPIDASGLSSEANERQLEEVEQIENEAAPELSKEQMKKLKKQQQEGAENRRRRKKEQTAQEEDKTSGDTIYQPKEVETGETASGFAPCFKKLAWANSAAEISSWRKALRDVAGPSIGLGVLLSFFAGVALALMILVEMTDLINGALFLWIGCGLGLLAGVISWSVLWSGIKSFFRFQENRDVMPAVLYLMTMVQTVILALNPDAITQPYVHCYLPVGLFILACSFFSRWVTASTALRNLRFLHSGGSKYYLHMVRDSRLATEMTRGVVEGPAFVAVNRRTESVSDFMKLSFSVDESDRMSRNLAGIGLMAALLSLGFSMLFTWDIQMGLTLMTAVCCLFSPVLALFLLCYPMRKVSRFMERTGGVVVSEKALNRYSLVNGAVLDAGDIFPQGFVTLCGMKTFGNARVDEVIVQAASMVIGSGSVLTSIFEGVVGKEKDLLRQVDDRTYEDGKGMTGFIGGQQIFLGNRSLLESRGIRLSLDEHRKWVSGIGCACVYLAVAGELCAVFMIRLQTSVRSEEAVQIFADNGISLSVRTVDSFLTPRLLGRLFKVNPDLIKILPNRLSPYVDRLCSEVRVKQAVAVNDGTISGFAGCAASAKRLSFMQGLNRVLMILSIVLGMVMLLMLTLLGSLSSVTPLVMIGYVCFWPVLGWLLQKLIRI